MFKFDKESIVLQLKLSMLFSGCPGPEFHNYQNLKASTIITISISSIMISRKSEALFESGPFFNVTTVKGAFRGIAGMRVHAYLPITHLNGTTTYPPSSIMRRALFYSVLYGGRVGFGRKVEGMAPF